MRQIGGLGDLAGSYDALLCDVWGVVHNGVHAFPEALEALCTFRQTHGPVVLITNAPRPADLVERQLDKLAVPHEAYDAVVTSGDVTRSAVAARPGAKVLHIGPERDLGFYSGIDVELVDNDEEAELISCTGLFDDTSESPEDYRLRFAGLAARELTLVCANPDIVVERGDRLIWCGGALARLYAELGGRTVLAGKPFAPIYDAAMIALGEPDKSSVLTIGDGLYTDIKGACNYGLDALFVTGGVHAADFGPVGDPDPAIVAARLNHDGLAAVAIIPKLK
ncbi:MAG TPA: TIGR01459 family HAD-type hydrolase [Afifellaceae bacterium]|nr:TIGR01459 family HAD-type hydrolase [Afifellaceae bacterium]